ncbi:MAG: enoyl-CoA hydratase/isomerase family protein [Phycisphaeraceae bacterium]|nr:enoyl-CoA hydratase/isomerase family protein [Phycisphaeraceae bacterium]
MITSATSDGIAIISLARPERRNALTPDMLDRLADLALSLGNTAQVLLVTGQGPCFCAGFDLDLCRDDGASDVLRSLLTGLSRAIQSLRDQPSPVVMAIHGAAIAGGCALLGGADIVVAERETKLGYPVTRLGISPAVSSPFMAAQLPAGTIRAMQLDPGLIPASSAHTSGLLSELVDGDAATIERGMSIARMLSAKPREALLSTRRLAQSLSQSSAETAQLGLAASLGLIGGPEQLEMLPRAWKPRAP